MDLHTEVKPIGPSDIIPDPFLKALTALSQEYGFWIRGGKGYDDRSLCLDDEIEVSGTH